MHDTTKIASAATLMLLATAALLLAPPVAGQTSEADAARALRAAMAGAHRSDANEARDRYRHPEETLLFFGFRPDMTVVEIWPGAGWYTEVLAPALKDRGKLYVAQYGSNPPFPYQRREMEALAAKVAAAPDVYGDITFTALGFPDELEIAPPASADLVVTFRNVHNWFDADYGPPNAPELAFKAMFGRSTCHRRVGPPHAQVREAEPMTTPGARSAATVSGAVGGCDRLPDVPPHRRRRA